MKTRSGPDRGDDRPEGKHDNYRAGGHAARRIPFNGAVQRCRLRRRMMIHHAFRWSSSPPPSPHDRRQDKRDTSPPPQHTRTCARVVTIAVARTTHNNKCDLMCSITASLKFPGNFRVPFVSRDLVVPTSLVLATL